MVPMHARKSVGALLFGVPALAGPGRPKAGHRTDATTRTGSWSQSMPEANRPNRQHCSFACRRL